MVQCCTWSGGRLWSVDLALLFFGMIGAHNDINVLQRSPVFTRRADAQTPECNYVITGHLTRGTTKRMASIQHILHLWRPFATLLVRQRSILQRSKWVLGNMSSEHSVCSKPSLRWSGILLYHGRLNKCVRSWMLVLSCTTWLSRVNATLAWFSGSRMSTSGHLLIHNPACRKNLRNFSPCIKKFIMQ